MVRLQERQDRKSKLSHVGKVFPDYRDEWEVINPSNKSYCNITSWNYKDHPSPWEYETGRNLCHRGANRNKPLLEGENESNEEMLQITIYLVVMFLLIIPHVYAIFAQKCNKKPAGTATEEHHFRPINRKRKSHEGRNKFLLLDLTSRRHSHSKRNSESTANPNRGSKSSVAENQGFKDGGNEHNEQKKSANLPMNYSTLQSPQLIKFLKRKPYSSSSIRTKHKATAKVFPVSISSSSSRLPEKNTLREVIIPSNDTPPAIDCLQMGDMDFEKISTTTPSGINEKNKLFMSPRRHYIPCYNYNPMHKDTDDYFADDEGDTNQEDSKKLLALHYYRVSDCMKDQYAPSHK